MGNNRGKKVDPPRATGRAFQMTTEEGKASTDVVSGTFLLNFARTRVLFDSGASFLFVSNSFYQKLSIPTSNLEDALVVELEDGDKVVIQDILRGGMLEIKGNKFPIDLMSMVIGGFDVVIGMDWLANNHAEIFCAKKVIRIPIVGGKMVIAYGERRKGEVAIITLAKARKCLVKGCSSFLSYVIDTKLEKKRLENVNVVSEFPDVFPDDVGPEGSDFGRHVFGHIMNSVVDRVVVQIVAEICLCFTDIHIRSLVELSLFSSFVFDSAMNIF
ncbi:hypothetical protein L6452_37578 [Arctium lappa]|uniref:Uncharacterized protein n=1 Tax=Arctium lappa TaxID=4217 RepID=A0ACB8Y3D5_ARCLA|nr:hypothetical protein L6452_37578 [Arctium lappa]